MVGIKHLASDEWMVNVQGSVTTHHRVRVTKADLARFAQGHTPEELLRASFQFLLEHESNTSILTSFDLQIIGHYFPEYEKVIRTRLRQTAWDLKDPRPLQSSSLVSSEKSKDAETNALPCPGNNHVIVLHAGLRLYRIEPANSSNPAAT